MENFLISKILVLRPADGRIELFVKWIVHFGVMDWPVRLHGLVLLRFPLAYETSYIVMFELRVVGAAVVFSWEIAFVCLLYG